VYEKRGFILVCKLSLRTRRSREERRRTLQDCGLEAKKVKRRIVKGLMRMTLSQNGKRNHEKFSKERTGKEVFGTDSPRRG